MTLNSVMAVIFCDFTEFRSFMTNYVTFVDKFDQFMQTTPTATKTSPKEYSFRQHNDFGENNCGHLIYRGAKVRRKSKYGNMSRYKF